MKKVVKLKPRISSLATVMEYEHEGLIERLQDEIGLNEQEARMLFEDTKRFLFLCGTHRGHYAPPTLIDECWHRFLLFMKDYENFCYHYFGALIYHAPKTKKERLRSDGSIAERTLKSAEKMFGDVRGLKNWQYNKKCSEKCEPSTNCQDPPDPL